MDIQICSANLENLHEVTAILNEVTLALLEKGINQWEYPWDDKKVRDQIQNNEAYTLADGRKVIGTFCIKEISHINGLTVEANSLYLSQIALLPAHQGKSLGRLIIDFACSLAKKSNTAMYLDCWAGNEKLKAFYSRNRLEYLGDFPEEDYWISVYKTSLKGD